MSNRNSLSEIAGREGAEENFYTSVVLELRLLLCGVHPWGSGGVGPEASIRGGETMHVHNCA